MSGTITINVDKERLISTLQENKAAHAVAYEKAKSGYRKVTKKRLDELLDRLINGELLERVFLDAPPDDHTGDYDDVIAMMQWSLDPCIELTQAQFKQYIQDDWGWKDSWLVSNTSYLTA